MTKMGFHPRHHLRYNRQSSFFLHEKPCVYYSLFPGPDDNRFDICFCCMKIGCFLVPRYDFYLGKA